MCTCFRIYITQSTKHYNKIQIYTKIRTNNLHINFFLFIFDTILYHNITATHRLKTGSKTIFNK